MPRNNGKVDVPVSATIKNFGLEIDPSEGKIRLTINCYSDINLLRIAKALTEFLLKIKRG